MQTNTQPVQINIDVDSWILPRYHHLLYQGNENIIEFLYGGRDSAKSYTTAQILIMECLSMPYFRCALIREQSGDIKDSQWQLIKDIINDCGLTDMFEFRKAPLEIEHKATGNKFIARGCNEPQNLKSITACNRAWIEEGVNDRESMTIILGTIRSSKSRVKVYYTFNPECEGNYHNWWLFEDYFAGYWNSECLSFSSCRKIKVKIRGVEKEIELKYRVTHSTYSDNPYITDERIALHESNKGYYYTVYTLGLFGYKITGDEFWTGFKSEKHGEEFDWNTSKTAHIVIDSNTAPYVSIEQWQIDEEKKLASQYEELPCASPHNSAPKAARKLDLWLRKIEYNDVVYIYGDSTANNKTTIDENNSSFFDKFKSELIEYGWHIEDRVGKTNPRVALSGDFINEIFENNYEGCSIRVHKKNCTKSIEDYTMSKKNKEGGILKRIIKNKETGVSYQERGHLSDCARYILCYFFSEEFEKFGNRKKRGMIMVSRNKSKIRR